jgi:hypothetical protein
MERPDRCPNCGSDEITKHTGSYCQDCGEPLYPDKSRHEKMYVFMLKHVAGQWTADLYYKGNIVAAGQDADEAQAMFRATSQLAGK